MVFRAFRKTVKTPKKRRFLLRAAPPFLGGIRRSYRKTPCPERKNPVGHFAGFGEGVTRRQQQPGQV